MKTKKILLVFSVVILCFTGSCDVADEINIFTDEDEVQLGAQLDQEIKANPAEYPIFRGNPSIKQYIDTRIFRHILNSPEIKKRDIYNYTIEIIDQDSILNAFATPGGYVYVYTGLIRYLDSEAALAGVIAHEIAHAERRHATRRMTEQYGISFLLSIALGQNPSEIASIAANLFAGLALLANSRSDEDESDEYSIKYLNSTRYYPGSVKFFFEKMRDEGLIEGGSSSIEIFLSTHPDPIDRINTANERLQDQGTEIKTWKATGDGIYREEYRTNILNKF